jgi:SAM-dependent methyltransferase
MFFHDQDLVKVMKSERMSTILCAGNGISQEPRALAHAGFQVVALDLSPRAIEIAREFEFESEYFELLCGAENRKPGGNVEFVVGDILDASAFLGPFDVIIERCTAQLYFNQGIGNILDSYNSSNPKNNVPEC